jgi:hypothetical protein
VTIDSIRPDIITVLVGEDSTAFTVEKHVLLQSSKFFKAASDQSSKSVRRNEVKLLDKTPRSFGIYLKWLRDGYFYTREDTDVDDPPTLDNEGSLGDEEFNKWEECYRLGHYLQDCSFKDACIDLLQEKMVTEDTYMFELAATIYANTSAPSTHRNFAIDVVAHFWDEDGFGDIREDDSPYEFLGDLIKYIGPAMRREELGEEEEKEMFFRYAGCKYHEHVALNEPCYKKTHPAFK